MAFKALPCLVLACIAMRVVAAAAFEDPDFPTLCGRESGDDRECTMQLFKTMFSGRVRLTGGCCKIFLGLTDECIGSTFGPYLNLPPFEADIIRFCSTFSATAPSSE